MVAVPLGQEIIVNATTPGNQYRPTIVSLASGGFTVAWQDASGTGSADLSDDVRFARFDGFGNRLAGGIDTLANTTTPGAQFDPSIAAGDNGKYVIAWSDLSETNPDFNNRAVRFQLFNEDGTKSGVEKIANATFPLSQDQPSVTVLQGGNIVVTWTSEIVAASGTTDIVRRVFDSSGNPISTEQVVNTQTVGNQNHSTVHALSTGGFAVVWQDTEDSAATGFQTKTFVRFYDAGGTAKPGGPIVANESTASDPQEIGFAELSNGHIVFTWTEPNTASPGDASGSSIRARIYDPASGTFAAAFTANSTTSNDQEDAQVAALDNGQFVVVWTDHSGTGGDTSFTAVRMQVFNSFGAKVGGEVLVNQQSTFEQENPAITVLDDFRFVVAWQDNSHTGTDTESFSIHSRIFDARVSGITLDGDGTDNSYQGSNFGDTIYGGGGSDAIHGGGGIDFLFGGIGVDVLDGGTGNDKMDGGSGDDTYYVDNAGDVVVEAAGGGTDTVLTSVSYALGAGVEVEALVAKTPASTTAMNLTGNEFAQTLIGNAGINVINGGGGADFMRGLAGNDIYVVDSASDIADESAAGSSGTDTVQSSAISINLSDAAHFRGSVENATLTGAANLNLTGNGLANSLAGNAGTNVLNGGAGADTLNGGGGADIMRGGADNDVYVVDNAGDVVDESIAGSSGIDAVWSSTISINLADAVHYKGPIDNAVLTGSANLNATGNALNNVILGNSGNNQLNGGAGADIMRGGLGNDNYTIDNVGDVADESIAGSAGVDAIYSSAISINLADAVHYKGTIENAVLTGSGNLNVTGSGIANLLVGNVGNNTLNGGSGADIMRGMGGNDNYVVDNAGDIADESIAGSGGTDAIYSSAISINLGDTAHYRGSIENAVLQGSSNLNLIGNSLNNLLVGNSGNNVFDGKLGADTMVGGAGNDVFRFDTALGGGNVDRINDYAVVNDQIQIDNAVFTGLANGALAAAAFFTGTAAHDADDRIIYNSATGALFFDSDGTGGTAQVQFATLSAGLAMAAGEFIVI